MTAISHSCLDFMKKYMLSIMSKLKCHFHAHTEALGFSKIAKTRPVKVIFIKIQKKNMILSFKIKWKPNKISSERILHLLQLRHLYTHVIHLPTIKLQM